MSTPQTQVHPLRRAPRLNGFPAGPANGGQPSRRLRLAAPGPSRTWMQAGRCFWAGGPLDAAAALAGLDPALYTFGTVTAGGLRIEPGLLGLADHRPRAWLGSGRMVGRAGDFHVWEAEELLGPTRQVDMPRSPRPGGSRSDCRSPSCRPGSSACAWNLENCQGRAESKPGATLSSGLGELGRLQRGSDAVSESPVSSCGLMVRRPAPGLYETRRAKVHKPSNPNPSRAMVAPASGTAVRLKSV